MLYFAYGSNLHHFQMKRRCKDSIFLKKINLKDFRLTFRSKYRAADIEPKKNSIVPGALFEISNSDEKKLVTPRTDALESAKSAYENSLAGSQLLFPDDEFDQLSVASSIIADTPML